MTTPAFAAPPRARRAPAAAAPPGQESERRRDLDLLRVLIVFGLIFFHTARIFDTLPMSEGVKNATTTAWATLVVIFLSLWAMPLMFVIAGFGLWRSLRKRDAAAFLRERARRLLVPFVVGMLLVVPPQLYVHLQQIDPSFHATYWQFLPRFFAVRLCPDLLDPICADPAVGLFEPAHLWFLKDLFIFSVVLLPLFLALRRPAGARRLAALTGFLAGPWAIWLPALPIAVFEVGFGAMSNGGWNHYSFALFLLAGALLAADARLAQAMGRVWRRALVAGLVLEVVYLGGALYLSEVGQIDATRGYDWGSLLWRAAKCVGGWVWIVAILGFGSRPRAARPAPRRATDARPGLGDRVLAYAGEAFLPVYILHQTVVFVIGAYVVSWPLPDLARYAVISLSALAATLLLYDLGVRRTRVTRWMFEMRPAADVKLT